MRTLLLLALTTMLATPLAQGADMHDLAMPLSDGGTLLYGIAAPDRVSVERPVPLILALHPGGERMRYYGSAYARAVVLPAVDTLGAVVVAPDCPSGSWADAAADTAVMALLERVMQQYPIDRRRVLVVGYSMGGRGTWFMASHHRELFTAAIPMAASTGGDAVETLGTMPTYIIHSRRDQIVPFAPAEMNAQALQRLGRTVMFDALDQPTHFDMVAYVPSLRRAVAWVSTEWSRPR